MNARVHSSILQGIDAIACEVEADVVESADKESNIRLVGLAEAAVVDGIDVIGVKYLTEAVGFLTDELPLEPVTVDLEAVFSVASKYDIDFSDVRGQETAKRALTISAAGGHNPGAPGIGPPGSGKTVYAGLLPFPRGCHPVGPEEMRKVSPDIDIDILDILIYWI